MTVPSLPIKRLFRVVNGSTPASGDAECWDGEVAWVTPEDLGKLDGREVEATRRTLTQHGYATCGTTLVPPGSLVLSTRAPIGHVAIAGRELCTNQGCKALRPLKPLDSLYFYFALLASKHRLQALGQGTTFQELGSDALGAFEIPAPNLDHQRAIASFLDLKTAAIDALIAKKERLIELLQEKRQALITQAVTKGLDSSVPMKESGVEWLRGSVPSHWQVVALRRIARIEQGNAFAHSRQGHASGDFPWFKVADMNRAGNEVEMTTADNYVSREVLREAGATLLPTGAVAFPRVGAALLTNKRRLLAQPSVVDDNTYALLAGERIRPRYLYLAMLLVDMASICSPGLVPTVTFGAVKDHRFALPSIEEQDLIVSWVDAQVKALTRVSERTAVSVEKLREYRQALITAAVTGKIDVSNEAA